jgi:hypothetical protein
MIFGSGIEKHKGDYGHSTLIHCQATGMEVNMVKSSILFNELEEEVKTQVKNLLPMNHLDLEHGIKYLSFKLKPNDYKYVDWIWLLTKLKLESQYGHGPTHGYHMVVD